VTKLALDRATPVRADTKVALAFQGLTGLADVSLVGGAPDAAPVVAGAGGLPTIYADANAGADLTQAARTMLGRIDGMIVENEEAIARLDAQCRDGDGDARQELAAARGGDGRPRNPHRQRR